MDGNNWSLKEAVREHWSRRAATFDQQHGHRIASVAELTAWVDMLHAALGPGPLDVLDLACGTGEVTRALRAAGYRVTGVDFAEPMVARARAKHGDAARFHLADVERTREPSNHFDAAVTRHLVWTLTDPDAAFAEWLRVLKPGGRLLVLDGNFARPGWRSRLVARLERWGVVPGRGDPSMRADHASILRQLPFASGLTRDELAGRLLAAGFASVEPVDHRAMLRAQRRAAPWYDALRLADADRFAVVATK
jgi:ubiquinone/menaquinone biosynthesis C-methylase UbiE